MKNRKDWHWYLFFQLIWCFKNIALRMISYALIKKQLQKRTRELFCLSFFVAKRLLTQTLGGKWNHFPPYFAFWHCSKPCYAGISQCNCIPLLFKSYFKLFHHCIHHEYLLYNRYFLSDCNPDKFSIAEQKRFLLQSL